MRGVFLQQPLEFRLEIPGDSWNQGDSLSGTLTLKNHADSDQPLKGLYLHLANGVAKKIKQKSEDAFKLVAAAELDSTSELASGDQISCPWTFELDRNCQISDKSQALHLVCGLDGGEIAGYLPINIQPHPHIQAVQNIFESSFSFLLRGQKSKKGWVESKLKPPSGKQYPTLDYLMLSCSFEDETLLFQYCFHVKKLEATSSTLEYKRAKDEFKQQLNCSDYLIPGGFIDNQPIRAAIKEALSLVESKF